MPKGYKGIGLTALEYSPITGMKNDFSVLLKRFVESGSVRYEQFAEIWRDMKMMLIFSGRQSDGEVREFTELCMDLAKSYMMPPNEFQIKIGGLYLIYALYFKQLFEPKAKVRVTAEEWNIIQALLTEVRAQKHYDIEYVFCKLRHSNAFCFVAYPLTESALLHAVSQEGDKPTAHSLEGSTELEQMQQDQSMVAEMMEGDAIDQLSAIHDQYHRVKCAMAGPAAKEPQVSLNMIDSNLVQYITKKITTFEFWKKNRAGKRSGRKRHDSGPTTSESEAESETEKTSSPKRKSSVMGRRRAEIKARAMSVRSEASKSRRHRQVHTLLDLEKSPPTPSRSDALSEEDFSGSKSGSQGDSILISPDEECKPSMPALAHLVEDNTSKKVKAGKKARKTIQVKIVEKKKEKKKRSCKKTDLSQESTEDVEEQMGPLDLSVKSEESPKKRKRKGRKSGDSVADYSSRKEAFQAEGSEAVLKSPARHNQRSKKKKVPTATLR